jgi:DNA-binding LacI/PurR family transcriptional regulator/AraC-like DNA-binding protein
MFKSMSAPEAQKKRIGLLLASTHTGSALNVWPSFARKAEAEGMTLFIFPGGKLASSADREHLRNPVYSLANSKNLDGLISWSSSIGYTVSREEFSAFHTALEPLPYVTIAYKAAGHACVYFDAYSGMKKMAAHFIARHGARKIAFLRGPDAHDSAADRFNGYRQAPEDAGIPWDERLVTTPFGWGNGEAACAQLLEGRGLTPGRDFDALIGSSDLMVFPAIQYLQRHGYELCRDYLAGGFNNSPESRILSQQLSTAHIPYEDLSGESFKILKNLLKSPKDAQEDVMLPCEVILRESCGCPREYSFAPEEAEEHEHEYLWSRYQREKLHSALNSLKCELLGTKERASLVESLARHLPKIGITTGAVMLCDDDLLTECMGSFSSQGICAGEGRKFPAGQLFPAHMSGQYADGVFMVQPLFIENRSLGYFLMNVPFYDGVILEELRSAVSYALKGIFLFEETLRAKQIAEQAERAKTEFFAAIGSSLYDPFTEVIGAIEGIEKIVRNIRSTPDVAPRLIQEELASLKSAAAQRQAQTNRLIDLTLSQMDEAAFAKTLFRPADVLPELKPAGSLPLFSGDAERLSEAFSLIRAEYGGQVAAKLTCHGIELSFGENPAPEQTGQETGPAPHMLVLAERIILLHQGELRWGRAGCSALLPWTTYTGQVPPRKPVTRNGVILCLSEEGIARELAALTGLPVITGAEKALNMPGRVAFIVWNSDAAAAADFARAAALGSAAGFLQTPFLCYGSALSGDTVAAAVAARIRAHTKGTALFIGIDEDFASWELTGTHIASAADFADAVAAEAPGLVVLGSADVKTIQAIRAHPATVMTPIIALPGHIASEETALSLCQYPRLVLCNRAVARSPEFARRVRAIASGDSILPVYTGALVKKAILYFNQRAHAHISRWKLADAVNVSEDYLTRIFRREMGFSLWEYLNNYRVHLAAELLTHTGDAIYEVAQKTGFQDQAYFCRVFKKIYGKAPGQLRKA